MKKIVVWAFAALSIVAAGVLLEQQRDSAPTTGALTLPPSGEKNRLIPLPKQKPMMEVGEKTKLFMENDAYLFGAQTNPGTAALSYRVGVGKEIENTSGNRWTGEVSFFAGDEDKASESTGTQTRLSGAYLRQITKNADFRAGLSTDLASKKSWSTLELQLSMELDDGLSLQLNHDQGKDLRSSDYDHQTAVAIEKKF